LIIFINKYDNGRTTSGTSRTDVSRLNEAVQQVKRQIAKVIVGQEEMMELLLAAILADGHVLIEGVPGSKNTDSETPCPLY
jgi:MoxR-like ATPase